MIATLPLRQHGESPLGSPSCSHSLAALFIQPDGCYANLPFVDAWPEDRDARNYDGNLPVVAHPPCQLWGNLAAVNYKRYGGEHNLPGNDGGCFAAAVAHVRRCGGVLEHPRSSKAFAAHDITPPQGMGWQRAFCGGWVCEVWQSAYGHLANKATWLYYYGQNPPLELDWRRIVGTHQVAYPPKDGTASRNSKKPALTRKQANATPEPFRDVMIALSLHANASDQTPRTQDVANTTDSLERLSASVLFGLLLLVGFISGPSSVGAQETPIDHPRPAESHRTTDKMDNTGNPIILGNEAEPRLEALSADTYGKSAFGSFGEPSPQTSGTAHSALESSLTDQVGSLSGGERASESTMQARRLSPTGFVLLGVIVQLLLMAATWSNVVPVEHPKWLSLNIRYTAVAVLITMLLQPYVLSLVSSLESSGALIHCPNVSDQATASK